MAQGIRLSEGAKAELDRRKEHMAEAAGVDVSEVSYDDAVRTFMYPEDWTGVDLQ